MPLVKDRAIVEDVWVYVADDEEAPASGAVIVGAGRWIAERESLMRRNAPVGVLLRNDLDPAEVAADLHRFGVVALEFPAFRDGRAYTQARLLRERYGFRGELRATGEVLRDQAPFMRRCGVDAFEIGSGADAGAFGRAISEISVFYQPAADGSGPAAARRQATASWAY